jgi:hypothetical protein
VSQIARAFNVCGQEVAAPSLRAGAGEVIDMVHAAQCSADATLIAQANDRNFDRDTLRDTRRTRRRAEEYANLLPSLGKVTNQGASDETRCASD